MTVEINPDHPKWAKNLSADWNGFVHEDMQQHWMENTLYQSLNDRTWWYMVVPSEWQADSAIDKN